MEVSYLESPFPAAQGEFQPLSSARPILPAAFLRNRPGEGNRYTQGPGEQRQLLLPEDTAETLCHPQVDTLVISVAFTPVTSLTLSFFSLLPHKVHFPPDLPCQPCLAACVLLRPWLSVCSGCSAPSEGLGPPGQRLCGISPLTLYINPCNSLTDPTGFCCQPSCVPQKAHFLLHCPRHPNQRRESLV